MKAKEFARFQKNPTNCGRSYGHNIWDTLKHRHTDAKTDLGHFHGFPPHKLGDKETPE